MAKKTYSISVIGDGGWGTTLAIHLLKNQHAVTLWGPFPEYIQKVKKTAITQNFFPAFEFLQKSLSQAL